MAMELGNTRVYTILGLNGRNIQYSFRLNGPLGEELLAFELDANASDELAAQIMDLVQKLR